MRTITYNGVKITEYRDGRNHLPKYKFRFQRHGTEYNESSYDLEKLKNKINKILLTSENGHLDLPVPLEIPLLKDVLDAELKRIPKNNRKKRELYARVYEAFLDLLPILKVDELTKADISAYIDFRQSQVNPKTEKPIQNATINKELSAIQVALKNAPKRFRQLHDKNLLHIEKLKNDYVPRTRTITENEQAKILGKLYEPKGKGERDYDYFYRIRLGHWIEFDLETGFRRKEIALLEPQHYDRKQKALVNFTRTKPLRIVEYFPLTKRAIEIIEERLKLETLFIFSDDGSPVESHYRKLREICKDLKIPYGRFTAGGFVPHDLRRNFGTEIVRNTDIKTASVFLGHADLTHTAIYLATDKKQMDAAVRKKDGIELKAEITDILKDVKAGKLSVEKGVQKLLEIMKSR